MFLTILIEKDERFQGVYDPEFLLERFRIKNFFLFGSIPIAVITRVPNYSLDYNDTIIVRQETELYKLHKKFFGDDYISTNRDFDYFKLKTERLTYHKLYRYSYVIYRQI